MGSAQVSVGIWGFDVRLCACGLGRWAMCGPAVGAHSTNQGRLIMCDPSSDQTTCTLLRACMLVYATCMYISCRVPPQTAVVSIPDFAAAAKRHAVRAAVDSAISAPATTPHAALPCMLSLPCALLGGQFFVTTCHNIAETGCMVGWQLQHNILAGASIAAVSNQVIYL